MEEASDALMRMDYLRCETLCLRALAMAQQAEDWRYYERILLPLQEARRQRRMIAAEGVMRLGTADVTQSSERWAAEWLQKNTAGCLVVSAPLVVADATMIRNLARDQQQHIEVLFLASQTTNQWTLSDVTGQWRQIVPAPTNDWLNRDLQPSTAEANAAASWYLHAFELLGDRAIVDCQKISDPPQRVSALQQAVEAVEDHELLHQALGQAVGQLVLPINE